MGDPFGCFIKPKREKPDTYVRVYGVFQGLTQGSVRVRFNGFVGGSWVPRSLIHGGDEIKLHTYKVGDSVELRVMEWKARELGLTF